MPQYGLGKMDKTNDLNAKEINTDTVGGYLYNLGEETCKSSLHLQLEDTDVQ